MCIGLCTYVWTLNRIFALEKEDAKERDELRSEKFQNFHTASYCDNQMKDDQGI
jgi:hypothetical protein